MKQIYERPLSADIAARAARILDKVRRDNLETGRELEVFLKDVLPKKEA